MKISNVLTQYKFICCILNKPESPTALGVVGHACTIRSLISPLCEKTRSIGVDVAGEHNTRLNSYLTLVNLSDFTKVVSDRKNANTLLVITNLVSVMTSDY